MALPAAAQYAIFVGIVAVEFVVARYTDVDAKLRALPTWLKFVVGGVATSPLLFLDHGFGLEGVLDPHIVVIVVSLTLWLVLPLLFHRAVEMNSSRRNPTGCQ